MPSKTYLDRIERLNRLEQEYTAFIGATSHRVDEFAAEYRSITQGTYVELMNTVTPSQNIPRDGLLDVLTSTSYGVGLAVRNQLEDLRYAIRAAKTANKLMLG